MAYIDIIEVTQAHMFIYFTFSPLILLASLMSQGSIVMHFT